VLNTVGSPDDFLGQLSEETFVIITAPERADTIRKHILDHFNRDAAQHYAFGERVGNRIKVKNSAGQEQVLPLLGLEAAPAQ